MKKAVVLVLFALFVMVSCVHETSPVMLAVSDEVESISISKTETKQSENSVDTSGNLPNELSTTEVQLSPVEYYMQIYKNSERLDSFFAKMLSEEFVEWIYYSYGAVVLDAITEALDNGGYNTELVRTLTGRTPKVLYDEFCGALNPESENYCSNIIVKQANSSEETVIVMAGDVSLADNWYNMRYKTAFDKKITDLIDPFYVDELTNADIAVVNNEFTISERGEPTPSKLYTLRAKPSNLSIYGELGVDAVSLANNHVYDFGRDAFLDTLSYLKEAGIKYVGAGENIAEASRPLYYIINGRKIAFVAGNRSEKYILTPAAKTDSPGVLRCYDSARMKATIEEASDNADFVIAFLHWGDEFDHNFNEIQQTQGYEYIDAGADIVVGSHTHCLQGAEFYNGKPIVYSLGNFWFSGNDEELAMLKITIDSEGNPKYCILPGVESYYTTICSEGDSKSRMLEFFESISKNVAITDDGVITEKK